MQLIEELILSMTNMTDTLGVPLFNDEIAQLWSNKQKHMACLQDVPGLLLYAVTNHISKGGIRLPFYRCARGKTSLELLPIIQDWVLPDCGLTSGLHTDDLVGLGTSMGQ